MGNNNNTLKIRIQIQQEPPQAIEEIYPEPEIIYEESLDWKKISIAALALLTIIILIGYLIFGSESTEKPINDSIISAPENTLPPEKLEMELDTRNESTDAQLNASIATRHDAQSITAQSHSNGIKPRTVIVPARKPEANSIPSVTNQSSASDRNIPKTASKTKPHQAEDHPEVLRALLTHSIKAREPVDSIDTIQLQPGENRPIHFYLQLKNLQGEKIRVDWYFNNELDSQLYLQVHNNNWRTHATKQLDHERIGSWRVELIDGSGNQLAIRDFTVTQN